MFDTYFEVFLADTLKSKRIHYSIRYEVYCEEMGFENKDDFPLRQEFDQYDRHASHFIVRHKQSGLWIGAMRLIFKNGHPLPIELLCELNDPIYESNTGLSVELSRLCLIKEARKIFNDILPPYGITAQNNVSNESNKHQLAKNNRDIIWGLIYAALKYSYHHGISNWYFLTTPGLEKVLRKGGLDMTVIGDPCEHKGMRYPFKMNVLATYQSEIWQDHYKNGYRAFSECNINELDCKLSSKNKTCTINNYKLLELVPMPEQINLTIPFKRLFI